MRIFKTTYRDAKGTTQQASKWYIEFRDHNETVRRIPAFVSKAASGELGRNIERLAAFYKSSGGQFDPALSRWLTELPQRISDRLVAVGLLDAERASVRKRLSEHLDDFRAALKAKGCTDRGGAAHCQPFRRADRAFDGAAQGTRAGADLNPFGKLE